MPRYSKEQSAVMNASRNRMQLRRQFGLTFQCVEVVLKLAHLRAFENPRASQSDVARILGINRSRVCEHLKRAAAANLMVRVGRSYFFRLSAVRSMCELAEIARNVAALKRRFVLKLREQKRNLEFVADCATHTIRDKYKRLTGRETAQELAADYYRMKRVAAERNEKGQ